MNYRLFGINDIEEQKLKYDINTYGNYQSGTYKGLLWEMKRMSTVTKLLHNITQIKNSLIKK